MSLILHYRFNDTTSNIGVDSSTSGSDLTNGGSVVSAIDATYGNVAQFDGSTSASLSLASAPSEIEGALPRTFSFWVNKSDNGFNVVHDNGSDPNRYSAFFNTGTTTFRTNYGVSSLDSSPVTFSTGTWFHIASTYDGSTMTAYVNGVESASNTGVTLATDSTPFTIGDDPSLGTGFSLNGYLSDFRVYDYALSASEMSIIHANGPNPPSGKYNKIEITADIETNIAEVEVFTFTPTNIALLGTASSTNPHSSGLASEANDGIITPLTNYSVNLTSDGSSSWSLALDTDYTVSEIEKVIFYNRNFNGTRPDLDLTGQNGAIYLHSYDLGVEDSILVGNLTSDLVQEFTLVQATTLSITMYTHAAEMSWDAVSGASTYNVFVTNSSGETVNTQYGVSTLNTSVYNLDDGESYDFKVYSDLDLVNVAYEGLANTTPIVDQTEAGNILTFLGNNLTLISSERVEELDLYIQDNLTTGDEIISRIEFGTTVRDGTVKYVDNADTVGFEEIRKPILTPFVEGDGAKSFLLTKSDTTTENITYDGLGNVTVDTITYTAGDKFILDGKVCRVAELN